MEYDNTRLINDDPLNITDDHFANSADDTMNSELLFDDITNISPIKGKEKSNDKSNQISLEENDIVNDNYKLDPSFSFAVSKT